MNFLTTDVHALHSPSYLPAKLICANSATLRYLQRSPSHESIDQYLRPIVAILFLWLNRLMRFAGRIAWKLWGQCWRRAHDGPFRGCYADKSRYSL